MGSHGGFKRICMETGALAEGGKRGIVSGLIPPRTSTGIAFFGRPTTSCKPFFFSSLSLFLAVLFSILESLNSANNLNLINVVCLVYYRPFFFVVLFDLPTI